MDFGKLSQTEKLAVYGSAAVIVGGLVGYSYGVTILAVLAAIGMLAIVFLPQMSPGTNLPGSKGSLMLIAGGVAGVVLLLAALMYLGIIFTNTDIRDIFFIVAVVGGVVMVWAGWQAFQAEGGKFQLGAGTAGAGTAGAAGSAPAAEAPSDATAAAASSTNAAAPEPAPPIAAPAQPTAAADPAADAVQSTGDPAADAVDEQRPPA